MLILLFKINIINCEFKSVFQMIYIVYYKDSTNNFTYKKLETSTACSSYFYFLFPSDNFKYKTNFVSQELNCKWLLTANARCSVVVLHTKNLKHDISSVIFHCLLMAFCQPVSNQIIINSRRTGVAAITVNHFESIIIVEFAWSLNRTMMSLKRTELKSKRFLRENTAGT